MQGQLKTSELRNEQIWLAVGSLMIIATVALAGALIYTRDVMVPFVLAIFITAAVGPLVDWQVSRLRLPSWLAVLTTLVVVLAGLTVIGFLMMAVVQAIVATAKAYSDQVIHLTKEVLKELKLYKINVDENLVIGDIEGRLPVLISSTVGRVTTIAAHSLLIVFFVVFLLLGRNPLHRRTGIYADIENTIRKYITTMTALSLIASVLVGIVLSLLGLQMAWLFAFLVFLLTYIPSIGAILATLLPLPIAVAQFHNPWMIAAVLVIPGTIHMLIGNFIAPKMFGRGMELHPVTVLLALAFWGLIWGIIGMLLAMPISATLRIILSRFSTTRPLADLLAGRLPGAETLSAGEVRAVT